MKSNRTATTFAVVALAVLYAATMASAAVHIRGSSENGQDGGAPHWLLLGRSRAISLTANSKKAIMTREIVCLNQDAENAILPPPLGPGPTLTLSGSCDSGAYMYVFQFQSTATTLGVAIGRLMGFDPTNTNNFGVIRCDSGNTIEMCTIDPNGTNIPDISVKLAKTAVTFTVPNTFPTYPQGTPEQGQGLTFFVITQQPTPLPIALPTVGIN
jgi:hypothetical protein